MGPERVPARGARDVPEQMLVPAGFSRAAATQCARMLSSKTHTHTHSRVLRRRHRSAASHSHFCPRKAWSFLGQEACEDRLGRPERLSPILKNRVPGHSQHWHHPAGEKKREATAEGGGRGEGQGEGGVEAFEYLFLVAVEVLFWELTGRHVAVFPLPER